MTKTGFSDFSSWPYILRDSVDRDSETAKTIRSFSNTSDRKVTWAFDAVRKADIIVDNNNLEKPEIIKVNPDIMLKVV